MEKKEKRILRHPNEKSNFFTKLTFTWLLDIFLLGYKRDLEESDLHVPLREQKSQLLGNVLQEHWQDEIRRWEDSEKKVRPNLMKCLIKIHGIRLIVTGIGHFVFRIGTEMAQPFVIANFLNYFSPNKNVSKTEACYWGAAICFNQVLSIFVQHHVAQELLHIGMKINVACSSLIYRKVLRLSPACMSDGSGIAVGKVINLLSNDVGRFDLGLKEFHDLWLVPLQLAVATYIIFQYVYSAAFAGVILFILCLPLIGIIGKRTWSSIPEAARRTDNRLRFMNEILKGIQTIKMYAWEKPFSSLIEKSRMRELEAIKSVNVLYHLNFSFEAYMPKVCIFASIATYVYLGNEISADRIYMMTVYYEVLRTSVFKSFPLGVQSLIGMKVSLKRIEHFLMLDEVTKPVENDWTNQFILKNVAIYCRNMSVKWKRNFDKNVLSNINIHIKKGRTVGIVGKVGTGKSVLLKALVGELQVSGGSFKTYGKIAYVSQEPWIFPSTIKQNIIFGQYLDNKRYEKVLSVCQLHRDLSVLPYGDETIVGDNGISLSGGQRARINLARAVYSDADIYLLDDPLSAVDAEVGRKIFDECLLTFLRGKTIVFVTHQVHYMINLDHIICLEDGRVVVQGKFEDLQSANSDFINYLNNADRNTAIANYVYDRDQDANKLKVNTEVENKEDRSCGKISWRIYLEYFKAVGNSWLILLSVVLIFVYKVASTSADYLIAYWVNMAEANNTRTDVNNQKDWYVLFFGGITATQLIAYIIAVLIFYEMSIRVSRNLHSKMLHNVMHATMRFFHKNPTGRIMNRFSKDTNSIDMKVPITFFDLFDIGIHFLFSVMIIASINILMLPSALVMIILIYCIRDFYITTSRNLNRLKGTTRSPIFDHLSSSFHGITTIRAFNAESKVTSEFHRKQDMHTSAFYLFFSASRAFSIYVDLVITLFMTSIIIMFLAVDTKALVGDVGLVMTRVSWMCFTVQWAVLVTTILENEMVSVERVTEYTKLEEEPYSESLLYKAPSSWPENGQIEFKDLSIKYDKEGRRVLENLNFEILPREKIGIVGRTGAGKTSLITALLRLAYMEGEILIDDMPVSVLGLRDLRSKISVIPQDPVLFEGSLRKNLDPAEEYDDAEIWKALEHVNLKTFVEELKGGLDTEVSNGGTNYSVGQRQLLCLARTILKKNKIIVLDEATANVDLLTDELIQETIKDKFKDCTVLTVAHRLNTVMNSSRILVMDNGSVVELDHPFKLLQRKNGFFYNLVHQTGPTMAMTLTDIARTNYYRSERQSY